MSEKFITIFTTTEKKEDAERISSHLLEARLVGCVQIVGPIQSGFWWEGKIEKAEEWLVLIKTAERLYGEVEAAIKTVHPYKVPEILAIPVTEGNPDYLNWLSSSVKER